MEILLGFALGILCWLFYEMAMVPKPPYIEDDLYKDDEGNFWRPVPEEKKADESDSLLDR